MNVYAQINRCLMYCCLMKISAQDFANNINHFTRKVCYNVAQEVMQIVAENSSVKINSKKGYQLFIDQCAYKVRVLIAPQSLLYGIMRKIYNRIK